MKGQIDLFSEIIVDNFAGGGGASTGIELATGRIVDIAINHDPDAILMHKTNHPHTEHLQASVWDVDPVEVCRGRPVGLAWFSPDCFVSGTLILTKNGYKPIEEICVGEMVFTHKFRWRPVVEVMQSVKPVCKVRGYGNPGMICSARHPFYTATKLGDQEPSFRRAYTLRPGTDYWGIPVDMISPARDCLEERLDPNLAWIAGRYVGDGWLRTEKGHYETVITCGERDIESLRSELQNRDCGFKWKFRKVRTGGQFTNCGKELCVWLLENFGKLSHDKTIPAWVFAASSEFRRAFLDGYMSADGWKRSDGLNEASTVSKRLAYGLVQLLATLNLPATVYYAEQRNNVIEGRKVNVKPIWKVKWREQIDKAHKQHFEQGGIIWRPIREVTDLQRTETVFNIGVADDESYVAEGVIVHNCKHFSKAKGAALVDRNIRGLAWIVLRWAGTVRPRVIILENVEEFTTWGPVRKGKPVKKLAGNTFRKWKGQLMDLGYAVEHRELVAADYGAPTIRKRFVLIARCDGKPIVWPERTHNRDGSGGKKKWRSAAEIIDWSLPMYSIFDSKAEIREKYGVNAVRPLADNTLRRIIRGVDKFTIKSGKPFLVPTGYGERKGQDPRVQDIDAPLSTVVSKVKQSLGSAQLIQYHTEQTEAVRASGLEAPMQTVDSSNRYGLVSASLTEYFGNGVPIDPMEPMRTVTSHDREALTGAHICKYYGGVIGAEAGEPLPTVTGIDHNAFCASHIVKFKGENLGQTMREPLQTVTAQSIPFSLCHTVIRKYAEGENLGHWPKIREMLNRHCGYSLKDNEILLLLIDGTAYYIRDILLRMLSPRELYLAMGFPPDYKIDRDYMGHEYGKTKQVARCGNAVCPPLAEAVVRANYEASSVQIITMAQLASIVSAAV